MSLAVRLARALHRRPERHVSRHLPGERGAEPLRQADDLPADTRATVAQSNAVASDDGEAQRGKHGPLPEAEDGGEVGRSDEELLSVVFGVA